MHFFENIILGLVHRVFRSRHFWRHLDFSEMAELYASRALRMLALSLISVFVAVYLYQNNFSLPAIGLYFGCFFAYRAIVALPAAHILARVGPKHSILISNFLYIPALVSFAFLPHFGMPALVVFALLQGFSMSLYNIAYSVDFSKVKHTEHNGKELAYMNIIEKVMTGLSPLFGGLLAYFFGPQVTIVLASVVFLCAALPLLRTGEPIKTHQTLDFKGFPFRSVWRSFFAEACLGVDMVTSGTFWSLYVLLAVLTTTSNLAYAQIGALSSITLLAALVISYVYGRIIDRNKGRELLQYSVYLDMLVHFSRPFMTTPAAIVVTNVGNEVATTGYNLPFVRATFDTADRLPGHRIVYMYFMEVFVVVGAAVSSLAFSLATYCLGNLNGMKLSFIITGILVFGITLHRFPLYRLRTWS